MIAFQHGLGRADLDLPTHFARVQDAQHQLDRLADRPPDRVVTSNAPV